MSVSETGFCLFGWFLIPVVNLKIHPDLGRSSNDKSDLREMLSPLTQEIP